MAQESCNLDKDDAEVLKPSPSSPSAAPSPVAAPASASFPPPVSLKNCEESLIEDPLLPEVENAIGEKSTIISEPFEPAHPIVVEAIATAEPPVRFGTRCSVCKKRTGLMGFRCRCGDLFCPQHRHSETHDCSFDYKSSGREEIARANPLVRASKIVKI